MAFTSQSNAVEHPGELAALDSGETIPRYGIVVYDARGNVVDAGPSRSGALGRAWEAVLRGDDAEPFLHVVREDGTPFPIDELPFRAVQRTGQPAVGTRLGLRVDQETHWLLVSAFPRSAPSGFGASGVVMMYVDVTVPNPMESRAGRSATPGEDQLREVEQARRQAVEAKRQTETLFEATRGVGDNQTLSPALNAVVDGCRKLFGADRIAVLYQEVGALGLSCLASFGFSERYVQDTSEFYAAPENLRLLYGAVEPYAITNVSELDWSQHPRLAALRDEGVQSALTIPLVRADRVSGSLILAHEYPRTYRLEEIRAAEVLARQAAIAIEHARVEAEARDVNRRLEEALLALQRTQEHVVQQERLRALGEMASGIAHDFNNALQHVIGFCDLLLDVHPSDLENPPVVRSYLQWMRTAANDAAETVRRLRAFYRTSDDRDPLFPIDVNETVRKTISLTQPRWRDQALAHGAVIIIRTELSPVPRLLGKDAELREALTNLIFNAVDALPNGGRITIRTHEDAGNVVLEVQDNGLGMSEDVRLRCLEPFFTTKGLDGSGLGLAMVYGTVTRLGGGVEVESQRGRGTLVRLTLPIDQDNPVDLESDHASQPGEPLRVLVADDEPGLRRILSELLEGDGHWAHAVGSGPEVIEALAREQFDLVITDRTMAGMSGDAVAAAAKARVADLPVIMLTGFGDIMRTSGQVPPGVDLVLGKPITADALRRAIETVRRGC